MRLPEEDTKLFYKLYNPLVVYANRRSGVLEGIDSTEDLGWLSTDEIRKVREALYGHPELIDLFVAENPEGFSAEELEILSGWKNFVSGRFLIFRYLKNYTIFLSMEKPPRAYGVLALNDTFEEIVGPYLPVMVEAVLLPFRDKITYDGVFFSYRITFGGGMRSDFDDLYQEAKSRCGIITSLPFAEREQSDADRLRLYLKSEHSREMHREEIEELISRSPELLTLYHQEMGRIYARRYRKELRGIGLDRGWFAVLEGTIIASGATKSEVERILKKILPAGKRDFVYTFQLGGDRD